MYVQDTTTTADGTTIVVPDGAPSKNAIRVNNGSELGADCGDLRFLVDGRTKVSFGRSGVVAAEVDPQRIPGQLISRRSARKPACSKC